jgi:hypothetical protein
MENTQSFESSRLGLATQAATMQTLKKQLATHFLKKETAGDTSRRFFQ